MYSHDEYDAHCPTARWRDIAAVEKGKTPILSEKQKIQLFQQGITDPYFNMIKGLVTSQRYKYDTFEKVKEAYSRPRPDYVRGPANDSRHISETRINMNNQTSRV
jgi:hypothetical protein